MSSDEEKDKEGTKSSTFVHCQTRGEQRVKRWKRRGRRGSWWWVSLHCNPQLAAASRFHSLPLQIIPSLKYITLSAVLRAGFLRNRCFPISCFKNQVYKRLCCLNSDKCFHIGWTYIVPLCRSLQVQIHCGKWHLCHLNSSILNDLRNVCMVWVRKNIW